MPEHPPFIRIRAKSQTISEILIKTALTELCFTLTEEQLLNILEDTMWALRRSAAARGEPRQ